jgi:alpha-beta hydrolase superfamily lysophospholipase
MTSREDTIAAAGGVTLHVESFVPRQQPRMVLVAVHGFSAHCGLYRHVGTALAEAGIAVVQFDCRGHGRSTGRRGHVTRFTEFVDDLALVIARAREDFPALPWALMGHSHGATIALDYVLGGRVTPDRLVLAAPWLELAMKVPAWKRLPAPLLSRLWPTLTLPNGIRAEDVSRNPAVVENFQTDPLVHHVASARWFREARTAQARIRGAAATLTVPTLLLLAGQDRIVMNEANLELARAAAGVVELRQYDALYHELFLELEAPAVLSDIAGWLCSPRTTTTDRGRAAAESPGILRSSP